MTYTKERVGIITEGLINDVMLSKTVRREEAIEILQKIMDRLYGNSSATH